MTTLAPNMPKRGATSKTLSSVIANAVEGFAQTEEQEGVPVGWDMRSAQTASELARLLGLMTSTGMKVELLRDQQPVRTVMVTRRSAENLSATLRARRESIGSVIGTLDTVSLHGKREAGLWLERTGRRIMVSFDREQIESVRLALGERVEISGRLTRDMTDRLVSVRMRSLEILPGSAAEAPAAALVGLSPDMIGDRTSEEHLEDIRGAS